MKKPLQDQVAIITGASRGIGRATALKLALQGAHIVVNYLRNDDAATSLAEEIEALGRSVMLFKGDVRYPETMTALFSQTMETFNRCDIFISNAAKGVFGPVERVGLHGLDLALSTGPKALYLGAQEALKSFGEKGGSIVAVSSIGSIRCLPNYTTVGTAKSAIETVVRYLAVELSHKHIRVNAVSGGPIDTDALDDFKEKDEIRTAWAEKTPLGRLGTAEEMANIIAFLCNPESYWIQGQTIVADGGLTLKL